MVGFTDIAAATSLKIAGDIAKAMLDLRDSKIADAKVRELQQAIIDAQGSVFAAHQDRSALIERVRDLEKQVADFEQWAAEKIRYQLTEVTPKTFAYTLKPEAAGAEPPHWICAACYQSGKKSILQGIESASFGWSYKCHACRSEIS